MKKCILIVLMMLSSNALAEGDRLDKAIKEGNWEFGASGGVSYNTIGGTNWSVSPNVQYFFMDYFSAGLIGQVYGTKNTTSINLGVIGKIYFAEFDRSIFYLSQAISYGYYESSYTTTTDYNFWEYTTTLGWDYFINSSVAIGPRFNFSSLSGERLESRQNFSLSFGLAVFF